MRRLLALSEREPGRAVAQARRWVEAHPDDAWARFALGWALLSWERFAEAREPLVAAQSAFVTAEEPMRLLMGQFALLTLDQRILARSGLEYEFAALADAADQAGAHHLAARARLEQVRQLNLLGRAGESEALLDQLAPLLEYHPLAAGRARRARAIAAYLQSDFQRARGLLAEAGRLFRAGRYRVDLARCWFERAVVAVYQERLDEALRYYQRAGACFDQADLPLHQALVLRGLGLVHMRQGRYDLAFRETVDALDRFRRFGRGRDIAVSTINLGNIHYYAGRWEAALATYTRAETKCAALGLDLDRVCATRNRAMTLRALGRLDQALELLAAVERDAEALSDTAQLAEAWAVQAAIMADQGRLTAAAERYARAQACFYQIGNRAAAAECAMERGWLALDQGDRAVALRHLAGAATALEDRPYHLWRVLHGLGRCDELGGDEPEALRRYLAASAAVATLRHRLAHEALSSGVFAQAARLHADALRLAEALGDHLSLLVLAEGQRALALRAVLARRPPAPDPVAQAQLNALGGRISQLLASGVSHGDDLDMALDSYSDSVLQARHSAGPAPVLDELIPDGALDLPRIRRAIRRAFGDDWTALVYSVADGHIRAIAITSRSLRVAVTPDDEALRHLVAQASGPAYRRYTYQDLPYLQGLTARPWERLRALAERLLPPYVLRRLHPGHRLLIVPAGPLHALPWALLRLDDGWLAERAVVQLLPSLTVAPLLLARAPAGDTAMLVGCSAFASRAPALPGVAAELAAVEARWPGPARRLLDEAATRDAILAAGSGPGGPIALLHLATHARQLPARGLAAQIRLADGDLLLPDLVGMALGGAAVVLSACEGASADVLPGEEVLSLSWGLLAGGASSVLASLWPVGDAALQPLVRALYDQAGLARDPAMALAAAQRRLLIQTGAEGALTPDQWGGLIAVGGGGPGGALS